MPVTTSSIKAWRQDAALAVQWQVEEQENTLEYQIEKSNDGRSFFVVRSVPANTITSSAAYKWLDSSASAGASFYRIKIVSVDGNSQYSKVVQVAALAAKDDITVSPNPAEGNVVRLHFTSQPKAHYQVKLFTADGRQILKTAIDHNGGSVSYTINLPAAVTGGSYQIQISNTKGDNIYQQVIIK